MKTLRIFACVILFVFNLTYAFANVPFQVVGYISHSLQDGNNRIDLEFDMHSQPFATMDFILSFDNPQGIIGDEIEFILDSRRQRYRISYDGTDLILTRTDIKEDQNWKLDSIPVCKTFWIHHYNPATNVHLSTSGILREDRARLIFGNTTQSKRFPIDISIKSVEATDSMKTKRLSFDGGRLNLAD